MKVYVTINGKEYPVEIRNGERFINGLSPDAFVQQLDAETKARLAEIGQQALQDERDGKNAEHHDYQGQLDGLEKADNASNN